MGLICRFVFFDLISSSLVGSEWSGSRPGDDETLLRRLITLDMRSMFVVSGLL